MFFMAAFGMFRFLHSLVEGTCMAPCTLAMGGD